MLKKEDWSASAPEISEEFHNRFEETIGSLAGISSTPNKGGHSRRLKVILVAAALIVLNTTVILANGQLRAKIGQIFQDNFKTNSNDVDVTVEAKVEGEIESESVNLPVMRVKIHEITSEEVKSWANVLFEGATAYEPDNTLSKAEIEQLIAEYKEINNYDKWAEEYGNDDELIQSMMDEYDQVITNLEDEYKTAPVTKERKDCDFVFRPYGYYEKGPMVSYEDDPDKMDLMKELIAYTDDLNGHSANLVASQRDEEDFKLQNLLFYYLDEGEVPNIPYKKLSESAMVEIADRLRDQLQLKDWILKSVIDNSDQEKEHYTLCYAPTYKGVGVVNVGTGVKTGDNNAANYYDTELRIDIYNGIVSAVNLTSPVDIVEVVDANPQTISYDEACLRFKEHVKTQYNQAELANPEQVGEEFSASKAEIEIKSVEQGLFRIKEQDKDTFLYVPGWLFRGNYTLDGSEFGVDYPFVIINALDGSVINPTLGY